MHRLLYGLVRNGMMTAAIILLFIATGAGAIETSQKHATATLYFFWGERCSACAEAASFVEELKLKYPTLQVESLEIIKHPENLSLLRQMAAARKTEAMGVPTFIIGDRIFSGFSPETASEIEVAVASALEPAGVERGKQGKSFVTVPFLGKVGSTDLSLPVVTIIIAALDSFNPCVFFVLFFLLGLFVHARSRSRMLLIGGTFVLFSGIIYFAFMAAWLNLFLLTGTLPAINIAAGITALAIGCVNVKDYFFFRRGVSLVIPEQKKPELFARMRNLLKAESLPSMMIGTVVLAVAANAYELLCTAGFPMVFTRLLTLQHMSGIDYYSYLILYNVVYIVPLAVVVAIFVVTLGSKKLTEYQVRVLKLVSGLMMLGLGMTLLVNPRLLHNQMVSVALFGATLTVAAVIVAVAKRLHPR